MIQEPIQPTSSPVPAARIGAWRRGATRCCWSGSIIAVLVAASVAIAVAARSQDPDRSLAAGASAGSRDIRRRPTARTTASTRTRAPKAGQGHPVQGGGPGRGPITIRAIDGTQVSLATEDGWTRTIAVTSHDGHHQGRPDRSRSGAQGRRRGPVPPDPQRRRLVHDHRDRGPDGPAGGEVTAVGAHDASPSRARRDAARVITVNGATVYKLGKATALEGGRQGRVRRHRRRGPSTVTRSPRSRCGSRARTSRARYRQDRRHDHDQAQRRLDDRRSTSRRRRPTRSGATRPRRWRTSPSATG